MTKNKYNYKTKSNFELLRYCAASFSKCWVAMNASGNWVVSVRKPKLYPTVGMWATNKVEDYHRCYLTKLPKRPASFAQHSLIRVNGKGLAWFDSKPDFVVDNWRNYYGR